MKILIDFINKHFLTFILIKTIFAVIGIFIFGNYFLYYAYIGYLNYFGIPTNFINIGEYENYIISYYLIKEILLFIISTYGILYILYKITFHFKSENSIFFIFFYSIPFLLIIAEHLIINGFSLPNTNTITLLISVILFYLFYFILRHFLKQNKNGKKINNHNKVLKYKGINYLVLLYIITFAIIHAHNGVILYGKKIATDNIDSGVFLNFEYNHEKYIIFGGDDNSFLTKKIKNNKLSEGIFFINSSQLNGIEINKGFVKINLD